MNALERFLRPLAPAGRARWRGEVADVVCGLNRGEGRAVRGAVRPDGAIWCVDAAHAETVREAIAEIGIDCEEIERPERPRASRRLLFFISRALVD